MLLSLAAPVRRTIRVDGAERVFWAQTPSAAPPASGWPVVLSFHGWCMTATQQADDDGLRKLGASTAIVVHPEGYSDPTDCQQYDCGAWQSFNGGGSAGVEAGGSDGPICEPDYVAKDGWQCYKSCEALGWRTRRTWRVHGASFTAMLSARVALLALRAVARYLRVSPIRLGKPTLLRIARNWLAPAARRSSEVVRLADAPAAQMRCFGVGGALRADILTEWLLYTGVWQPALTRWLCSSLQPGDVFVDVGANSGYFALLAAARGCRVVAVEACATTFEALRSNLALNGPLGGRVRALQLAAGNADQPTR